MCFTNKHLCIHHIMYCQFLLLASILGVSLCGDYKAVDVLDLTKYTGKWYQVYEDKFDKLFQKDGKCATAEYGINDNGTISVFNQQIDLNGKYDNIRGYAYYKDGDCCGYLTVHLDGATDAPYWVLELGPVFDGYYDYSIISDNKALSLFVLTRDVKRYYQLYDYNVLKSLVNFGFNKKYNTPITMNQTNCQV